MSLLALPYFAIDKPGDHARMPVCHEQAQAKCVPQTPATFSRPWHHNFDRGSCRFQVQWNLKSTVTDRQNALPREKYGPRRHPR